jgi:hypothetical protein
MIFDNLERTISEPPESILSPAELQRYARHLSMEEVALTGQRRLKASRVLVRLTADNCRQIISQYDLVVDGSTTSPPVTWSTTRVSCFTGRASGSPSTSSTGRRVSSARRRARATDACIRSRRRPSLPEL